jgi:hypothetical protein
VELVIRIALMFFFIQFLVVVTILTVALLLVPPDVPFMGHQYCRAVIWRSVAAVIRPPSRGFWSMVRRVQSMHLRSAH